MKKVLNIIFYVVIFALVILKAPSVYKNFQMQNTLAQPTSLKRLSGEEITFPVPNQKMVVVFWATWCGPCKVELNRLNTMMAKGEIKSNEMIAINIQETKEQVNSFLKTNPLQFLIALDESGKISESYNVSGTPTVVFLDQDSKINWLTTGLSPTLEYRVKDFLKN